MQPKAFAAAGSSPWVTFISAPSGFYQSFVTTSMYLQQAIHMAYAGHCFIHSAHFLKMKVLNYSNWGLESIVLCLIQLSLNNSSQQHLYR